MWLDQGRAKGTVLRGWKWATVCCNRKHEEQALGSAVWEPVCLGWEQDGTSNPEKPTQPTDQGFLVCHCPVGSSGKEEAKKSCRLCPSPTSVGKCAAQDSQAATALPTQEEEEQSKSVAEDKPAGWGPMPCGNWIFEVLYEAATELLLQRRLFLISDNTCEFPSGVLTIQPPKFSQIKLGGKEKSILTSKCSTYFFLHCFWIMSGKMARVFTQLSKSIPGLQSPLFQTMK